MAITPSVDSSPRFTTVLAPVVVRLEPEDGKLGRKLLEFPVSGYDFHEPRSLKEGRSFSVLGTHLSVPLKEADVASASTLSYSVSALSLSDSDDELCVNREAVSSLPETTPEEKKRKEEIGRYIGNPDLLRSVLASCIRDGEEIELGRDIATSSPYLVVRGRGTLTPSLFLSSPSSHGRCKSVDCSVLMAGSKRTFDTRPIARATYDRLTPQMDISEITEKVKKEEELTNLFSQAKVPGILPATMSFTGGMPVLNTPFYSSETLSDFIINEVPTNFSEQLAFAIDVGRTIVGIHELCNYVHLDIKTHNIMLDEEPDRFHAHLVDFDLSSLSDEPIILRGTPGYMAPELLDGNIQKASFSMDVWSFGITLFELFHRGEVDLLNECGKLQNILFRQDISVDERDELRGAFSKLVVSLQEKLEESHHPLDQLISSMISEKPEDRPTMHKVVSVLSSMKKN